MKERPVWGTVEVRSGKIILPDKDETAAVKAASYMDNNSVSRSVLIGKLLFEDFPQAKAKYGVSATGL